MVTVSEVGQALSCYQKLHVSGIFMSIMKNASEKLNNLRHSCAHVLAAAVMELWPKTKRTIGPAIENGFYYDFDFKDPISDADLLKIEQKMTELLKDWEGFERDEVSFEEAKKRVGDNEYKKELIDEFATQGETLTFYKSGNFEDLCRGGHTKHPNKDIGAFKLLSTAGAYWRGDEKNKMLTRIYGTCFSTYEELDTYLKNLEEAKRRDHRKLGQELGLFTFSPLVGSGLPLYTPKGALVRRLIQDYVNELQSNVGFEQVWTPQVARADLFKTSGHYDKFKGDMFRVVSNYTEDEMFLKPMNCPMHTQIYASNLHSYRDLPLRYADFTMLYRDEKPGELSGLTRVRAFSQDDAHVFCREDQIGQEFSTMLDLIKQVMETYGLTYWIRLSLRDEDHKENYLGNDETWQKSQHLLEDLLKDKGLEYKPSPGEAAFYGPKMDLMAKDSLGREWQLSTIQIDFNMPERFGLKYTSEDGSMQAPVMIHRAITGSLERFMAVIIEHFGGAFPTWLSPVQVAIVPIADRHADYAEKVAGELRSNSIRCEVDERSETMQNKIRAASQQKVPYVLVVGDKEKEANTVAIRTREGKDVGQKPVATFLESLKKEIQSRALSSSLQ